MNKILIPVASAAILLFATSCSYDKTGTSFEVTDANEDENVNPAHIRGYGDREPGADGKADPKPNQYYAFSTRTVPAETRQQLEGNVAVEMVTVYYSPSRQLSDLAEQYSSPGNQGGATSPAAADTAAATSGTGITTDSGTGDAGQSNDQD